MNLLNNKPGGGIPLGFVVAITFTLFGCGGEGSEGSTGSSTSVSPNTQSATLSAQNATYSTGYAESFEIDLSSKVFSSTGGGFVLSEVEVLSNDDNCQLESMTETGFIIQASDTKVCDYRYHVTPKTLAPMSRMAEAPMAMSDNGSSEGSSSAVTRIAVSSDPSSTELVPVSATTLINEGVSVSLKAELDKVGFTLGDEFVLTDLTLPYARSSSAQINDIDDQVLEYTPPAGFTGIDRILYTLEDSANGLVLMGVLDIAVGYEANQGFTINDDIVYPEVVDVFTATEIDISDFVSSDDGDDYQLVYVETFNADATSKDPLNTGNKKIVFHASLPGYHYISFAVSDHNGAYDMGLIRVEVTDPNQSSKWEDISHLLDLYIGPPTALDAAGQGSPYDMKLNDVAYSPAIDMASFRYPSAVAYCDTIGASLPTGDQLVQMTADTDVQLLHNWPVQAPYLAYDEVADLPIWVDLTDGSASTGSVDPTSAYYITCVKQGLIDVLSTSSTKVVANGVDVGTVSVELRVAGEVRPDTPITASVSSPSVTLDSDTVTTDNNGRAEFSLKSFKAETVTLILDVGGITEGYDLKFIGDEKTAAVSSEVTINNRSYSSTEGNLVTAMLIDQNGNPIEGYSINSSVSAEYNPDTGDLVSPIIKQEALVTDGIGEQKLRLIWDIENGLQLPTRTLAFDVITSYITSTGSYTESISEVLFSGYMCGQINDNNRENAVNSCVKIVNLESDGEVLFVGSPSVDFLSLVGFSDYLISNDKEFGLFNPTQGSALCETYNSISLYGRNNWYVPSSDELLELFSYRGNMSLYGWSGIGNYWSSTPYDGTYLRVNMNAGTVLSNNLAGDHRSVSCTSKSK